MTIMQPELFYIADPMCSWCYGFAPVMEKVIENFGDDMKINPVVGGLRVEGAHLLSPELKETLVHHWHEVEKQSGQPFNYDFDVPENFVYNTEPSCRAVVTMRRLKPESAFPYFDALHRAFYAENKDVTDTAVLRDEAEKFGLAPADFDEWFTHTETCKETYDDFAFSQGMGITGFPSIVLKDERGLALLTAGDQAYENLEPNIVKWLETGKENRTTQQET